MRTQTIFILVFLVLCSFAYAVPPFQISTSDSGFQLETTRFTEVKQNQPFQLHIHLFNFTNGVLIKNDTAYCQFHLYNHSGHHILKANMSFDNEDEEFEYNIAAGNFSKVGQYAYILQCRTYTRTQGGFSAGNYEVTDDGEPSIKTDTTAGLSITLLVLIISIGLFYLFFSNIRFVDMEWANYLLKRCCLIIAIWLTFFNISIIASLANASNITLTKELFAYMNLFGWAGYLATVYLVIKTLFDTLKLWKISKDKRRLGEE
jgi:hypothetical protein